MQPFLRVMLNQPVHSIPYFMTTAPYCTSKYVQLTLYEGTVRMYVCVNRSVVCCGWYLNHICRQQWMHGSMILKLYSYYTIDLAVTRLCRIKFMTLF